MIEIEPKLLWIGTVQDARDISLVLDTGIEALVDLALDELTPTLNRELIYCRFPLIDGEGNSPERLRAAVETVVSFLTKSVPTFVFCSAGMSRSPCIAAVALSLYRKEPFDSALESILSGKSHDVSPTLWAELTKLFSE